MVTLAQTIMLLSEHTVGIMGEISNEQLVQLQEIVSDSVNLYDPGFTPAQRLVFTAYFILDFWESRPGRGGLTSETVLDTKWTSNIQSSSAWMDKARDMVTDFRAVKKFNVVPHGVTRVDAQMDRFRFDNTEMFWRGNR